MTDDNDPYPPEPAPSPSPSGEVSEPSEPSEPEVEPEPAPESAQAALRDAVGVSALPAAAPKLSAPPPRHDDDDFELDEDEQPKKRNKLPLVVGGALIVGGVIATFALLGRANSARYVFQCGEQRITAEQGRSFPPWGASRLGGAEWKPIDIPPDTECRTRETEKRSEVEQWYLDALVEQAQNKLTAKEVTAVDDAEAELQQAMLLARDPDRQDQRKDIDRLLGDVEYWRGAARVKAAVDTLQEAGKMFDEANEKRPRHASDAASWAQWTRQVAGDLAAGPGGKEPVAGPSAPTPSTTPTGVALPVEEPAEVDAGVAPADAGPRVPRGGVLL